MKNLVIHTPEIRLAQALKWANLVGTGGEARILIDEGRVAVNGEPENAYRRRLFPGDKLTVDGEEYLVVLEQGEA